MTNDDHIGRTESPTRRVAYRHVALIMGLLVLVAAEAWVILFRFGLAHWPIALGSDGIRYNQAAINVLDHGYFSSSPVPPYEPELTFPPGYPLFLMLVSLIGGRSPLAIRIAQFGLMVVMGWLIYLFARRFARPRAGAIAALFCACYWPFIYFATHHMTEVLGTVMGIVFVLLFTDSLKSSRRQLLFCFLTGCSAGLAALVRPSFLLIIGVPLMAYLFSRSFSSWRQRSLAVVTLLVGLTLCVAPWLVRNTLVAHKFVALSTGSGASLFLSSQQYARKVSNIITIREFEILGADGALRRAKARKEVAEQNRRGIGNAISPLVREELILSRDYTADAIKEFKQIPVGQILSSIPGRLASFWSDCDDPPFALRLHPYVVAQHTTYIVLVLLGCWISRRQLRQHWPLWIMPVYLMLIHTIFETEPRYSLPARPFLLIYAGIAVDFLLTGMHSFYQKKHQENIRPMEQELSLSS